MLNYSFYLLFILSFTASVVIVLDVPLLGFNPKENPELYGEFDSRWFVWLTVMWMFVGIPFGAIAVNIILSGSSTISNKIKIFRSSPCGIGWNYSERLLYRVVFISSALLVFIFIITMPRESPLLHLLYGGGVVESQIIRKTFTFGFENVLLKSLFNDGTLTLLSLISFIMSLQTGQRKWWGLFAVQCLILVFLYISIGIAYLLYYLVALAFCRAMSGGKFVKLYEILLLVLLFIGLFIVFKGAEGSLWQIITGPVFHRVCFSQLLGMYYSLQIFPTSHDFLWFSSSGRWLNEFFTGSSSESYGIIMMSFYDPAGVTAGHAGHFTSIFLAEAWVNFGIFGIIVAPLCVGIFVQLVNRFFLSRPKNVILLAFYVYLATTFGYASDFVSFYYPPGTILFVLGASLILLSPKIFIYVNKIKKIYFYGSYGGSETLTNRDTAHLHRCT